MVVDIENIEPFSRVRKEVGALYESFVEKTDVHFEWLKEILGEAQQAFQKPDVELLPKTPSEKRKRGRQKRGSVQKRESSAKKRHGSAGRAARKSQAYLKVRAAILDMGADTGAESEANQSSVSEADNLENIEIPVPTIPPAIAEDDAGEEEHAGGAEPAETDGNVEATDQVVTIEPEGAAQVVVESVDAEAAEHAAGAPKVDPGNALVVEEHRVLRTPEPAPRKGLTAGPPKSLLPVPVSGTKEKLSTPSVLTPRVGQPFPINRYTPQKSAVKTTGSEARERMNQQMAEATAKRDELLKLKIEEQKRKREERAMKVAKQRMLQKAKDDELKRKIEEKYLTPSVMDIEEKRKLRPRYPDSATKKPDNDHAAILEKEKAKEKERIQREQEEMQRLKAVEQERQLKAAPPVVQAAPKQVEAKEVAPPPSTQPKNPAVFHQPQDTSVAKVAVGKPKISRETFTVANAATTSANSSGVIESYDMTPLRKVKPATASNYDISDLRSSDETDDEEHPRKKIPAWAQGGQMKMALTQQYYNPPDLDELFGVVQMPDLAQMFTFQRKRFFKRTSSAKWDSPIHPHVQK